MVKIVILCAVEIKMSRVAFTQFCWLFRPKGTMSPFLTVFFYRRASLNQQLRCLVSSSAYNIHATWLRPQQIEEEEKISVYAVLFSRNLIQNVVGHFWGVSVELWVERSQKGLCMGPWGDAFFFFSWILGFERPDNVDKKGTRASKRAIMNARDLFCSLLFVSVQIVFNLLGILEIWPITAYHRILWRARIWRMRASQSTSEDPVIIWHTSHIWERQAK